jgi:Domain of unknown function (DUF397)
MSSPTAARPTAGIAGATLLDETLGAWRLGRDSSSVDVADPGPLAWIRSSFCGGAGSCVEVANLGDGARAVRDGKSPESGPILVFTGREWDTFISGIKAGEFD